MTSNNGEGQDKSSKPLMMGTLSKVRYLKFIHWKIRHDAVAEHMRPGMDVIGSLVENCMLQLGIL